MDKVLVMVSLYIYIYINVSMYILKWLEEEHNNNDFFTLAILF